MPSYFSLICSSFSPKWMNSFIVYSEYRQVFFTSVSDNWVNISISEIKLLEILMSLVRTTKNPRKSRSV
jgi:hypothetical protein